jgi:hypothetical protein
MPALGVWNLVGISMPDPKLHEATVFYDQIEGKADFSPAKTQRSNAADPC